MQLANSSVACSSVLLLDIRVILQYTVPVLGTSCRLKYQKFQCFFALQIATVTGASTATGSSVFAIVRAIGAAMAPRLRAWLRAKSIVRAT